MAHGRSWLVIFREMRGRLISAPAAQPFHYRVFFFRPVVLLMAAAQSQMRFVVTIVRPDGGVSFASSRLERVVAGLRASSHSTARCPAPMHVVPHLLPPKRFDEFTLSCFIIRNNQTTNSSATFICLFDVLYCNAGKSYNRLSNSDSILIKSSTTRAHSSRFTTCISAFSLTRKRKATLFLHFHKICPANNTGGDVRNTTFE